MSDEKKLPKRRFKQFLNTPSWEQRKLTDISKIFIGLVTTMTTNYREEGTLLIRNSDIRDNKFIFSEKPIYLDSEFAKSNESRKLKSGDVVTVHTGDIGTSAVVEEDIEGAIGFATINTRPDIKYLDSHFLSTYFNTESHKKYAISVATGDGRSNYNIKDFNKLMLYMPSVNEQKAIAEFIKRITNLITLHQRKLNKLEKLKKAYLEELFPDGNQCKPKRRFKEFKDDWEQRKLGEVAKVEMDKRIYKEQTTAEGEIPFYKIGTFGGKADSYISEELYNEYTQKYPHPKEGDILISASGSIGRTVVYHGEKAYFQDSNIVWLNHKGALDNGFLLQFYSRVQWAGLEGSTIKRLYNKNILETEINIPDIEEQKNIGKFFTQVDNLITLHQRKLQKLKKLKEAYLDELFV